MLKAEYGSIFLQMLLGKHELHELVQMAATKNFQGEVHGALSFHILVYEV